MRSRREPPCSYAVVDWEKTDDREDVGVPESNWLVNRLLDWNVVALVSDAEENLWEVADEGV